MKTLGYFTLLLLCQLAGEALAALFALPVPGPVIGMAILLLGLVATSGPSSHLEAVSGGLLAQLALLFVPAGVGVVLYLDLIARQWLPLAGAILGGTLVTIAFTGRLMQSLSGRSARK